MIVAVRERDRDHILTGVVGWVVRWTHDGTKTQVTTHHVQDSTGTRVLDFYSVRSIDVLLPD